MPDLITVLDSQNGAALGTPDYRYGLRVTVIALAGHPRWTATPEGLQCGGPGAFGYVLCSALFVTLLTCFVVSATSRSRLSHLTRNLEAWCKNTLLCSVPEEEYRDVHETRGVLPSQIT